jgi:hypothetical protein
MKKLLLASVAALFLATGTAHAEVQVRDATAAELLAIMNKPSFSSPRSREGVGAIDPGPHSRRPLLAIRSASSTLMRLRGKDTSVRNYLRNLNQPHSMPAVNSARSLRASIAFSLKFAAVSFSEEYLS